MFDSLILHNSPDFNAGYKLIYEHTYKLVQ